MQLIKKLSSYLSIVRKNWKTPAQGSHVAYKEILSYGIGGIGVQFVITFSSTIGLSAGSFLVGSAIGIQPMHLQYMSIFMSLSSFIITIIRSYLIDSMHFKLGKFRSWLAYLAVPTFLISLVFVWLPYETMAYNQKIISVFVVYLLLQCVSPFYNDSYYSLVNVISPNSKERTDIISISSIIWSLSPTITNATIPMLSGHFTGGLANIQTYRIIYPAFALFGIVLTYFAVYGTRERITQAKSHVSHYKFSDALRAVAKNKYFWITSLAGWIGFLEGASGVLLGWYFIYGHPDKMGTYTIAMAITGNSALFGMILAPILIRKIGKRFLLISCNICNIIFIGATYFCFNNIIPFVAFCYLNGFVGSFAIVYNPGINADIRDYQQYKTGERIDGMFGTVGLVGTFIGMFTGMVLPTIYESLGLKGNYNVLEVASFREDMFATLIIASVIGAALNVVPYLFYDFTETKQKGVAGVLKIRALFEDYSNGLIEDSDLAEALDLIDGANRIYEQSKSLEYMEDINNSKLSKKERKNFEKEVIVSGFIVDEINKFSTERVITQLERAKKTVERASEGIYNFDGSMLRECKAMPKATSEQKIIRTDALSTAKQYKACSKKLKKYYPDGIKEPDKQQLLDAENLPDDTLTQKLVRKKAIKAYVNENSRYNHSLKVLLDAQRLIKEEINYSRLDEIRSIYEKAKAKNTEGAAV